MGVFWRRPELVNHERVQELLSSYLDGAVSPREREQTEEHLTTCEACRRELEELRATVNLVQGLPQVAPPHSFTLAEAPPRGLRLLAIPWGPPLATATTAMLFALLVLGDVAGLIGPSHVAPTAPAPTPEPALIGALAEPEETPIAAQEEEKDAQEPTAVARMAVVEEGEVQEGEQATPQPQETEATVMAPTTEERLPPDKGEQVGASLIAPTMTPAPGLSREPLLQVPFLPWLQVMAGALAAALGALWLLRWRKAL